MNAQQKLLQVKAVYGKKPYGFPLEDLYFDRQLTADRIREDNPTLSAHALAAQVEQKYREWDARLDDSDGEHLFQTRTRFEMALDRSIPGWS